MPFRLTLSVDIVIEDLILVSDLLVKLQKERCLVSIFICLYCTSDAVHVFSR